MLAAIEKNPDVVGRDGYADQWAARLGPDTRGEGVREWGDVFADPDDPARINVHMLRSHRDRIAHELRHVVNRATKTIAQPRSDRARLDPPP